MQRSRKYSALALLTALAGFAVAARPPETSGPGRKVNVQMIGDAKGMRFEPASITVHPGDTVVWTNTGAVPHNVQFWADSIPAAGKKALEGAMPKTTAPLAGPMLLGADETYTVSFAKAAPGVYKYYCLPHLALGMVGQITVKP
jgi:plastocyanin